MNNICYVTSYYNINRESWTGFSRSFDEYLIEFNPYIKLFNKDNCGNDILIVFMDEKNIIQFKKQFDETKVNIKVISTNDEFMNTLHIWKTLEKEQEIMNDDNFKQLLGSRCIYPEHIYPKYTLINHCKIDLICSLFDKYDYDYYAWVDFGFFKLGCNIPSKLIDINKLNLNTINYSIINPLEEIHKDILYNLQVAPEIIGGFFFFGRKDKLLEYQELYHLMLEYFQNKLNIADDDQHLALQCYFQKPELFTLHFLGAWHKALVFFQKE